MRSLFLLTILSYFISTSNAQTTQKQALDFLTQFTQNNSKPGTPLYYTKGINSYTHNEILKALQRSSVLYNFRIENHKVQIIDSLVLSKEEQQFIIKELQRQVDTSLWNQFEIPNSQSMPKDTITAIFKDRANGWRNFYNSYGKSLFSFSIPIFFRDNQYCAFFYANSCGGLCGEELFSIYRKEFGAWSLWITVYESVS